METKQRMKTKQSQVRPNLDNENIRSQQSEAIGIFETWKCIAYLFVRQVFGWAPSKVKNVAVHEVRKHLNDEMVSEVTISVTARGS